MKMKRKDLEEVNDDFSDFSLSSPARKIRRLDAELPPIMENEESAVPFTLPAEHLPDGMGQVRNSGPIIEELPNVPENEERAIVLFNPINRPLIQCPANVSVSVSVNPDMLSLLKNQIWSGQSTATKSADDESTNAPNATERDQCLAVVPWVKSRIPAAPETEVLGLMDDVDMGEASMDIEEENVSSEHDQAHVYTGVTNPSEGLHQWQQQHCLIPQLPQSTSAPIVWFR